MAALFPVRDKEKSYNNRLALVVIVSAPLFTTITF